MTPEQIAKKWQDRAQVSAQAYLDGVLAVTDADNPMEKAAAAQDHWYKRITDAKNANRFADGCRRVSLRDWKRAVEQKGKDNYATGVGSEIAKAKMLAFMREFIPFLNGAKQDLPARGTPEQNTARAVDMIKKLRNFRRGGGSGPFPQMGGAP